MPKEFIYRITKKKINLMNQQEAQDLLNILKRRNLEERSSIENAYNVEKKHAEEDRSHAMRRIEERITKARIIMSESADKKHRARGTDDWSACVLDYENKRADFVSTQRELSEMNVYYQGVFRELLNKRDYNLRRLVQQYSKEYAEIMSKVERVNDEEKVSYWKHKYYATKAELEKLREERAA